jgi:hypothetical protein
MCVCVLQLLLLRNFGPYGLIFMNACVFCNLPLRDFAPYGATFMNVCVCVANVAVWEFWALWFDIYECVCVL